MSPSSDAPSSSRVALVVAAVAALLIERLVPYGHYLLYPFTLLATWVHEMGHGVTALLVGGGFDRLEIFGDASGLAHVSSAPGLRDAIVCAGGLIAPPLLGAFTLAFARGPRRARGLLLALAAALALSLAIYVRTPVGWLSMVPLMLLISYFALRASADWNLLLTQFIAIMLALDTVTGIDYLFTGEVTIAGEKRHSDIWRVADALGGPYLVWGCVVAALSFVLLAIGLWIAWRRPRGLRQSS